MSEMSWRDRVVDWCDFYGFGVLALCLFFGTLMFLLFGFRDERLSGTVEDVVAIHGKSPYSIVTIDGEEYRYDGDVAPEEGDEIIFIKEGEFAVDAFTMTEWRLEN